MISLVVLLSFTLSLHAQLPTSGDDHPVLNQFDNAMQAYLSERGYKAATLAMVKDGQHYKRGYGYQNKKLTRTINPDTPMRIASISKMFTQAAIKELTPEFDVPVFGLLHEADYVLDVDQGFADTRVHDITVRHLLDHVAGFDNGAWGFDPAFMNKKQLPQPLRKSFSQHMMLRYMLSNYALHTDPGSTSSYSNFGYILLQHVIQKLSGTSYMHYLRTLTKPLNITTVQMGFRKRREGEIWYDTGSYGWKPNILGGAGGLICSAPDLCRFMQGFWITGDRRAYPGQNGYRLTFFGSLPTTTAMVCQFPDGTDVAVLINARRNAHLWDDLLALEGVVKHALGHE